MRYIKNIFLILLTAVIFNGLALADEEKLPRKAVIVETDVNLKAGDNINYESLCVLEKGTKVKVIGKRYSWYQIELPQGVAVYIKNDYVDVLPGEVKGIVNATRVNLRAGPGVEYSVLGMVSKPQELKIIAEKDGWYKIESPKQASGWIFASQLNFIDEPVEEETTEPVTAEADRKKPEKPVEQKKTPSARLGVKSIEPPSNLTISDQQE